MEKIAHEVLVCLSVLGRLGIVHCDLKPENVLLVDERSLKIKVRCGPFWFKLIPWFVNLGQTSSMWCYSWLHEFLDLRLCVYLTCDYSSTLYLLSVVPFWCYWLKEYFVLLLLSCTAIWNQRMCCWCMSGAWRSRSVVPDWGSSFICYLGYPWLKEFIDSLIC